MATCAALPAMRRRADVPRPSFSIPAGWLVSAGAIALGVWLVSNNPWSEVRVAGMFVFAGVVLYFACTHGRRGASPVAAC